MRARPVLQTVQGLINSRTHPRRERATHARTPLSRPDPHVSLPLPPTSYLPRYSYHIMTVLAGLSRACRVSAHRLPALAAAPRATVDKLCSTKAEGSKPTLPIDSSELKILRTERAEYFTQVRSIGPKTAERWLAKGCHSFRDVLARGDHRGSGIDLGVAQRRNIIQHRRWLLQTEVRQALVDIGLEYGGYPFEGGQLDEPM